MCQAIGNELVHKHGPCLNHRWIQTGKSKFIQGKGCVCQAVGAVGELHIARLGTKRGWIVRAKGEEVHWVRSQRLLSFTMECGPHIVSKVITEGCFFFKKKASEINEEILFERSLCLLWRNGLIGVGMWEAKGVVCVKRPQGRKLGS